MLAKGTPGWVYEARRKRLLLERIAHDLGTNHITHKRSGHHRSRNTGWRRPVDPPYIPYPVGYRKEKTQ